MKTCVHIFACAIFLLYLGKGVYAQGKCEMKKVDGTASIIGFLDPSVLSINDETKAEPLATFKFEGMVSDKTPEVFSADRTKNKYITVEKNAKTGAYELKTTKKMDQYVANENTTMFTIEIVYFCPYSDKSEYPRSVMANVSVTCIHTDYPKFTKDEKNLHFNVPFPMPEGVELPGVKFDTQYISFKEPKVTTNSSLFETILVEKGDKRTYTYSLKTKQAIDLDKDEFVFLTAQDPDDANKKSDVTVTLKVDQKKSSLHLTGPVYIDQRTCENKDLVIAKITLDRGDSENVAYTVSATPDTFTKLLKVSGDKTNIATVTLISCPEYKDLEKNNVVILKVMANVNAAMTSYSVPIMFKLITPVPDGGSSSGLTVALVIFILISIATSAGLLYFWWKVRNMSSSFP